MLDTVKGLLIVAKEGSSDLLFKEENVISQLGSII
jgi:hypothetical protein